MFLIIGIMVFLAMTSNLKNNNLIVERQLTCYCLCLRSQEVSQTFVIAVCCNIDNIIIKIYLHLRVVRLRQQNYHPISLNFKSWLPLNVSMLA